MSSLCPQPLQSSSSVHTLLPIIQTDSIQFAKKSMPTSPIAPVPTTPRYQESSRENEIGTLKNPKIPQGHHLPWTYSGYKRMENKKKHACWCLQLNICFFTKPTDMYSAKGLPKIAIKHTTVTIRNANTLHVTSVKQQDAARDTQAIPRCC